MTIIVSFIYAFLMSVVVLLPIILVGLSVYYVAFSSLADWLKSLLAFLFFMAGGLSAYYYDNLRIPQKVQFYLLKYLRM